jgi:hypothetical protein
MKYYLLSPSTNEKEIGAYFQTEGLPKGYTSSWYDEPNSMTKLTDSSLPSFTPNLRWELKPEALLTDIISAGNITATGFLMSLKAKNIFEKYFLPQHKFHNSELIVNNNTIDYYYLQLIIRDFQDIDLERSSFGITNAFRMKENDVTITSYDDLIEKQESLEFGNVINAEEIFIKNTFFDLFFFPFIHNDIFASEKLLNDLSDHKITGYDAKAQHILQTN